MDMSGYQTRWQHHRSGWSFALDCIQPLHFNGGPKFIGYLDGYFSFDGKAIHEPWTGFLHGVPEHPVGYSKYQAVKSLDQIFELPVFKESKKNCVGIFTLCDFMASYISKHTGILTNSAIHPTELPALVFSKDNYIKNKSKKVLMIGHWLRKFESIGKLNTLKKRCILKSGHFNLENDIDYMRKNFNVFLQDITFLEYQDDDSYDLLLSENIVFLDLYDVAAANGIVDCIVRNTPLLINRLPAAEEYLGKEYPLFYDNLAQAENLLNNDMLIFEATNYLKFLPIKKKMTKKYFIETISKSEIYTKCKKIMLKKFLKII